MTVGHFLNVDLEIESRVDLASLATELEPAATTLYCGPIPGGYLLSLEAEDIDDFVRTRSPDETIHQFCRLIEALSPTGNEMWREASRRTFDVGFDANAEHVAARFGLREDTLERIVRLRATLTVTVYRPESA